MMKKAGVIHFEKAEASDAKSLAEVSARAFDNDINYGAPGPGGPPSYKSGVWQRNRHFYQKIGFVEVAQDGHNGVLFEM